MICWILTQEIKQKSINIIAIYDDFNQAISKMIKHIYSNGYKGECYPDYYPDKNYAGEFIFKYDNKVIKLISYNIPDDVRSIFIEIYENNNKTTNNLYSSYTDAKNNIIIKSELPTDKIYFNYILSIPNYNIINIYYWLDDVKHEHIIKECPITINNEKQQFILIEKLKKNIESFKQNAIDNLNKETAFDIFRLCLELKISINKIKE